MQPAPTWFHLCHTVCRASTPVDPGSASLCYLAATDRWAVALPSATPHVSTVVRGQGAGEAGPGKDASVQDMEVRCRARLRSRVIANGWGSCAPYHVFVANRDWVFLFIVPCVGAFTCLLGMA